MLDFFFFFYVQKIILIFSTLYSGIYLQLFIYCERVKFGGGNFFRWIRFSKCLPFEFKLFALFRKQLRKKYSLWLITGSYHLAHTSHRHFIVALNAIAFVN